MPKGLINLPRYMLVHILTTMQRIQVSFTFFFNQCHEISLGMRL